jgi:hypothetical protein
MISSVMDLSGGNRNDAVRRDVGRAEYPNLRVDVALSAYLASALRAALIIRSAFAKTGLSIILPSTATTAVPP